MCTCVSLVSNLFFISEHVQDEGLQKVNVNMLVTGE